MILWEPPVVKQLPIQQLPFGADVTDVDGSVLKAALDTLVDLVGAQVRAAHPTAPDAQVTAAVNQAAAMWLTLLNQSIGDPAIALARSEIEKSTHHYSHEFSFLAKEYGRLLTGVPDFAAQTLTHLLPQIFRDREHPLDVMQAFSLLSWAIHQFSQAEIQVLTLDQSSAVIEWQVTELEDIHSQNRRAYLQTFRDLYTTLWREIPRQAHNVASVEVHEQASVLDGDESFRWVVNWSRSRRIPVGLISGVALSAMLIALVALTGENALSWVALLPALGGCLLDWARPLHQQRDSALWLLENLRTDKLHTSKRSPDTTVEELTVALKRQVDNLYLVQDIILSLGATLNFDELITHLLDVLTDEMDFDRAMLLLVDEKRQVLTYGDMSHPAPSPELQLRLENLQIAFGDEEDDDDLLISTLLRGETALVRNEAEVYKVGRLNWVFSAQAITSFLAAPLRIGERLIGAVIVDNSFTGESIGEGDRRILSLVSNSMAIAMDNARLYSMTDEALEVRVAQLRMQQQIDRELNASLKLDRVMLVTIDWALRFTNASAGSVTLYDETDDTLRIADAYGYPDFDSMYQVRRPANKMGIAGRVARTGQAQLVEDVIQDPDYVEMAPDTKSQMAVPILLENRVVGVLSLESIRTDIFGETQLEFAERLADRAAVAIVNTRLFLETQHEREKLSTILASTADGVIVAAQDGQIELINPAACAIFELDYRTNYQGKLLTEVLGHTPIVEAYEQAVEHYSLLIDEFEWGKRKFYHLGVSPVEGVGWVMVLQNITHFKEVDRLKSELLAQVSHDLKNPLNVMTGYIELINMHIVSGEKTDHYLKMIRRSISHMSQLITDLLEMARIESGITMEPKVVDVSDALWDAADTLYAQAQQKDIYITVDVEPATPPIWADPRRLRQILLNLIGNAIKYTPVNGEVRITAETKNDFALISVIDNGLGIAPENQDKLFDRFYRERRPETEAIEGTGLGLAIAKGLVETHGGIIGLESKLDEGSIFYFTIPSVSTGKLIQESKN